MIRNCVAVVLAVLVFPAPEATFAEENYTPTVLVTGSNRGIGLEWVRHYADEGWHVIATCRTPERAAELNALAQSSDNIVVEELDVTDLAEIDALAAKYEGQPIDILLNNAALLGDIEKQVFGELEPELFERVMAVNVYGPLRLSEVLIDNVAMSQHKKITALTSGLGSIAMTERMGRFYFYRMSKAALNMGMRALRADLKRQGIIVSLISPGMVATDMLWESGYRGEALTTEESVDGMAAILANQTIDDPGLITNTDGQTIPW